MKTVFGLVLISGVFAVSIYGKGVSFKDGQMIRMSFNAEHGLPPTDLSYIQVGFSTTKKQGILMQVVDGVNQHYVSLEINNKGGVRLVINRGNLTFEMNSIALDFHDYTKGKSHAVTVRRTHGGQHVIMKLTTEGSTNTSFGFLGRLGTHSLLERPQQIYMGKNETSLHGFEGCITGLQIDNLYPLRQLMEDSVPSYVDVFTAHRGCF